MTNSINCATANKKIVKRDAGLDLLRIICTMMVVCNHLLSWTGLLEDTVEPMTSIWLGENILFVFLLPAVNCFVLISGFFLCTAKFKLKKLGSLWLQAAVYSVGLYMLVCLFDESTAFSFTVFIKSCLVITMERYWFVTAYVLLYIVSPFLNFAIHAMSRRMHAMCCMVLLAVFSILPNLVYIVDYSGVNGGYSFLWFCVMYVVAAYIRLYLPVRVKYQKWMFPIAILCALFMCGEKFLAHMITPHIFGTVVLDSFFYSYNSIVAVPCAVALFQGFRGLAIHPQWCKKAIGFFAPLTFAVYLIHSHPDFIRALLSALDVPARAHSFMLFPYLVICTCVVVLASCFIEWLRQWLFRVCGINKLIERTCDRIQNRVQVWLDAGA